MKKFFLAVTLTSFSTACGNNECEDAKEKAVDCGGIAAQQAAQVSDDDAAECSSQHECWAKCVNASSCAELNALSAEVRDCISACGPI
jgi:hypothetical protein